MSQDQKFFDLYSLLIGALAVFALAIFVLAVNMSENTQGVYTRESPEYKQAVMDRIAPVGQVYMPGDDVSAAVTVIAAADEPEPVAEVQSGPQVYNSACLACHGAGIGGAPVLGDASAWTARIDQGMDTLVRHAIEGYTGELGYMPPKGGRVDLSDEEVAAAVEYMVAEVQ
ncbi:MAG: c-type cytochrome [Pseudomonadota bacterium]